MQKVMTSMQMQRETERCRRRDAKWRARAGGPVYKIAGWVRAVAAGGRSSGRLGTPCPSVVPVCRTWLRTVDEAGEAALHCGCVVYCTKRAIGAMKSGDGLSSIDTGTVGSVQAAAGNGDYLRKRAGCQN